MTRTASLVFLSSPVLLSPLYFTTSSQATLQFREGKNLLSFSRGELASACELFFISTQLWNANAPRRSRGSEEGVQVAKKRRHGKAILLHFFNPIQLHQPLQYNNHKQLFVCPEKELKPDCTKLSNKRSLSASVGGPKGISLQHCFCQLHTFFVKSLLLSFFF